MKTGFFYTACAITLALSACQNSPAPLTAPAASQTAPSRQPVSSHPVLTKAEASGSVSLAGQTLTLTLALPPLHQHSAFSTQKLDLSSATQLVAQVSDSHGKTYAPVGADGNGAVNYSAGTVTLTFENVVPDELLFVEVQAQNGATPIPQASLATVLKHTSATSPVSTTINFQTSVAARALKALLTLDAERARAMDLSALETLTAAITGVSGTAPNLSYAHNHPSLVNTALLATQLLTHDPSSLSAQAASFRQAGATVNLTIAGLNGGDRVQVQITDAASAIQSDLGNGSTEITGLTPGSGLTALVSPFGTPAQTYTYTLSPSPLTLTEGAATNLTVTATPKLSRLYVNDNASGSNNGSSWDDAYTSLQTALAAAGPGDEIWVAEGTYTPHASDSSVSFVMKADVDMYGGFAGTESELSERSPSLTDFVSVLSGDLSGNDDPITPGTTRNENAYHVVKGANNAILDGFTIQDGNARGSANVDKSGGGMYNNAVSPTLSNVILDSNTANLNGGGMYNTSASPSLTQVTLSNNYANNNGGGIYNQASSPILTQVRFSHNETRYTGGGMHESIGSSSSLTDVDFSNNLAQQHGGGLYTSGNNTLTNVTFTDNTAYSRGGGLYSSTYAATTLKNGVFANNFGPHDGGGWFIFRDAAASTATHVTFVNNRIDASSDAFGSRAIANEGPIPSFQNLLFWNNSARGVAPGQGGNVFAASNPFVDSANPNGPDGIPRTADDGLRLTVSAAGVLDQGISGTGLLTDILGLARDEETPEPGAYEYTGPTPLPEHVIGVDPDATGNNDGSSWADAYTSLHSALDAAVPGDEIWLAAGTYTPHASDRSVSFVMKEGVDIYGGFAGSERALSERSPSLTDFVSVLSGDLSGNDNPSPTNILTEPTRSENAYHVVKGANNALLDGVTIQGGNANAASGANSQGGGMYNDSVSPRLTHVTLSHNTADIGGGMFNLLASPSLSHVTVSYNRSSTAGGGMMNGGGSPSLNHVTVSYNESMGGGGMFNSQSSPSLSHVILSYNRGTVGGGMNNELSTPTLTHVTLSHNTAQFVGGGMSNTEASPSLVNVSFTHNTAYQHGGGLSNSSSSPSLTNVVLSHNAGGEEGGGIYNRISSAPVLKQVTLAHNTADADEAISNDQSTPVLLNVLLWNNDGVLADALAGVLVASSDPFVDSANPDGPDGIPRNADDGLRISPLASEVLNAGINTGAPNKDILDNDRPGPGNANAEPGAYEYTP